MSLVDQLEHPDEPLGEMAELVERWGPGRVAAALARVLRQRARAHDDDDTRHRDALDDAADAIAEAAGQLRYAEP